MGKEMDIKYIRIAELAENIEEVNKLIELHQKTTKNTSMIKQYQFRRNEFVTELQELLTPVKLSVSLNAA